MVGSEAKGNDLNESKASPIKIEIAANSSNPEEANTVSNNHASITIPVIVEADIILRGLVICSLIISNLLTFVMQPIV